MRRTRWRRCPTPQAEIAFLKLAIEKLRRELYGQRSERKERLLDQLELQLDELEASATEDELAAERAAADTTEVKGSPAAVRAASRSPRTCRASAWSFRLPRLAACCGSERLSKIGEDITETLEVIPRRWKVIQTVREKFTCRRCEKIGQPPAPFHPTPRGWAGPNLLAMILFEKYGQHQPLNRQRDRYAREGVDLSLSTLADQVGACTVALRPLHDLIADHVLAAERLHGDDTPVPVLARGRTATGRAWVYVRDDAPFGGADPPAALFRYSRDRSGDHPVEHLKTFAGILQADLYAAHLDAPVLDSLQTLNRNLWAWIEGEYHNTRIAALRGAHRSSSGRSPRPRSATPTPRSTSTRSSSSRPRGWSTRTAPSASTAASTRSMPCSSGRGSSCATTRTRRPRGRSMSSMTESRPARPPASTPTPTPR